MSRPENAPTYEAEAVFPALEEGGERMRGVTAGAIVFAGVAAANAANAAFNLVAGRWLGPQSYGDLAALLAVLALVSFPLGAAQYNVAAWIAGFAARRDVLAVSALGRRSLTLTAGVGGAVALLLLAVSVPLRHLLGVHDLPAVVLLALAAAPSASTPAVLGVAQGLERYKLFAAAQAAGPLIRFLLLPLALAAGFGVTGAMGATFVGAVVTVAVAGWVLRPWFQRVIGGARIDRHTAVAAIGPVTLGIIALTSLTTIDVVVAKLSFSSREAGIYGGASLIARLILYVPAAIASVLLPKVSSRSARGHSSADIFVKSLVVTAALCLSATALYALLPGPFLKAAYGAKYAQAESFLWLFAIAMTGFALVNVVFVYHIAHNARKVPFVLAGAAVLQILLFAFVHETPRQLLFVSTIVAYALLVGLLALTLRFSPAAGRVTLRRVSRSSP